MPRSRKTPTKAKPIPKSTKDVPVTLGMLETVRDELIERMDAGDKRLRAEIHEVKASVDDVKASIHGVKASIHGLEASIHGLEASIHEIKASQERMATLMEEQNARNQVVLEALHASLQRHDQHDARFERMESTLRSIVAR